MSDSNSISSIGAQGLIPDLPKVQAFVLVVDLVESVRLMQLDESGVISRWRRLARQAADVIVPACRGRLVKSLGDGLMVEFGSAADAVHAALALHRAVNDLNHGQPADRHLCLRAGLHGAQVYVDEDDIYGSGVNLAARLTSLAGPGETIVSGTVRDGLTDGLDADVEDLGDCYLKHIDEPVRVYRVGSTTREAVVVAPKEYTEPLRPTIAIIPFDSRSAFASHFAVGELIADGVIAQLSHARHLRVISRLSATALRGREGCIAEARSSLGATYIVSGSYSGIGEQLTIGWELSDARTQIVIAAGRERVPLGDLFDPDGELVHKVAHEVHDAIVRLEVRRVQTQPLPTLESYALLLGGVQLLHRSSTRDFDLSFALLSRVAEMHPRSIEPRLWQAKWYALRAVQGLSTDRAHDTAAALACTAQALDREPNNSFALAMDGFVHCHLSRDYDTARERLDSAIEINPSETFGQLFSGVVHGLTGEFDAGLASYAQAESTSPLDPSKYLLESVGSYLYLGAHQPERAITLARSSLRRNRLHAHTWRILTVAHVEVDDIAAARISLRNLLAIQPDLTVNSYLAGAKVEDATRRRFADAMRTAGLAAG